MVAELAKAIIELATSAIGLAVAITSSGLSIARISPVLGPGRALTLAISSYIAKTKEPPSVRVKEMASVREWLKYKGGDEHSYRVVIGEKGVGKTYMLGSALYRTPGVVWITAKPGESEDNICSTTLKEIGKRTSWSIGDPIPSARRTIACYRFMFRRSPIVVIRANERSQTNIPSQITGATRTLTDTYNLRVIVDSSPNSLEPEILGTKRQNVMQVERMSREQIFSIPKFADLFQTPEAAPWADIAWEVLGGNPQDFVRLRAHIHTREAESEQAAHIDEYIAEFTINTIYEAIQVITEAPAANPGIVEIFKKLRAGGNELKLEDIGSFQRSVPDKLFRQVKSKGCPVLIPASNALDLVIRFDLKKEPSVEELRSLVLLRRSQVVGSQASSTYHGFCCQIEASSH
jgi:hypothetical protein